MTCTSDLRGRKRRYGLSVLMMALPTLFIGVRPTYAQFGIAASLLLMLIRIAQGAATGEEAPGAWVFVTERVSQRRPGSAVGPLKHIDSHGAFVTLRNTWDLDASNPDSERCRSFVLCLALPSLGAGYVGLELGLLLMLWPTAGGNGYGFCSNGDIISLLLTCRSGLQMRVGLVVYMRSPKNCSCRLRPDRNRHTFPAWARFMGVRPHITSPTLSPVAITPRCGVVVPTLGHESFYLCGAFRGDRD